MQKPVFIFERDSTRANCMFDPSHCDTYTCQDFPRVARRSDKTKVVVYVYECQASLQHTPSASFTHAVTIYTHHHFLQIRKQKGQTKVTELQNQKFLFLDLRFVTTSPYGLRKKQSNYLFRYCTNIAPSRQKNVDSIKQNRLHLILRKI